jgi:acetyl-CoA C-acetyltransferase
MTRIQNSITPNEVFIAGVGLTPAGEHWEKQLRELALDAISAARADAAGIKPQVLYVANMFAPALSRQSQLGALIADFAGMRGIEAITVEAAGASGGMALRQAYLSIITGQFEVAVVVGVEKVTERTSSELEAALIAASDADYESVHGITNTAQAALLMKRYMHEYQAPEDAFAGFSLNAHANAVGNPNALFRRALNPDAYLQAAMVSDPVNLYDAAPVVDGAAAVILVGSGVLPNEYHHPLIRIAASSSAVTSIALHDRPDPLVLNAAEKSVERAYDDAGTAAQDIDLFELHDRYSIFAALALEAAGFALRGEGWKLARDGEIEKTGRIPICTFGGSKARGDTGGATGVYQAVEAALQLQGRAAENQVADARIGMLQCLGGTGATAVTHIFERMDGS